MNLAAIDRPVFGAETEIGSAHLVGICGAGMRPLAHALLSLGLGVSGSDPGTGKADDLLAKGAKLFDTHASTNVGAVDVVVYSSAIPDDNPELVEARRRGILLAHRSELLAWFLARRESVLVAGTHGKTTTTTMLALAMEKAGLDPWAFVGGRVTEFGGNLRIGGEGFAVAEADESDGSFLCLPRDHAIITNIEPEHLNYWKNEDSLFEGFRKFCAEVPSTGKLVLCLDDPGIDRLLRENPVPHVGYSTAGATAEFRASNIELRGTGSSFDFYRNDTLLGRVELGVPGRQNVGNATGALALAISLGADPALILKSMETFEGVDRRFTKKLHPSGALVVDDYGHHPTEITVTMAAATLLARERGGKLHVVFQPHRYSRTQDCFHQFGPALSSADSLILTDIYPAGEQPIAGIDSPSLLSNIRLTVTQDTSYIPCFEEIKKKLEGCIKVSDVVLLLGAGSVTNLSHLLSS